MWNTSLLLPSSPLGVCAPRVATVIGRFFLSLDSTERINPPSFEVQRLNITSARMGTVIVTGWILTRYAVVGAYGMWACNGEVFWYGQRWTHVVSVRRTPYFFLPLWVRMLYCMVLPQRKLGHSGCVGLVEKTLIDISVDRDRREEDLEDFDVLVVATATSSKLRRGSTNMHEPRTRPRKSEFSRIFLRSL